MRSIRLKDSVQLCFMKCFLAAVICLLANERHRPNRNRYYVPKQCLDLPVDAFTGCVATSVCVFTDSQARPGLCWTVCCSSYCSWLSLFCVKCFGKELWEGRGYAEQQKCPEVYHSRWASRNGQLTVQGTWRVTSYLSTRPPMKAFGQYCNMYI